MCLVLSTADARVQTGHNCDGFDHPNCPPPDRAAVNLEFGGDTSTLTNEFRAEIARVNQLLGCCSETICSHFGINRSCTIADVPYTFTGLYWQGMFEGPLHIAADFAQTFLLQAASGLEYAWGELSFDELRQLSRVHER